MSGLKFKMDIVKIAFTGTRRRLSATQREKVIEVLKYFSGQCLEVHHGDCVGADAEFDDIVVSLRTPEWPIVRVIHPPTDLSRRALCGGEHILPERDYLKRHHDMVNVCSILIGCPFDHQEIIRSRTWATIRYARMLHRVVIVI